jgi:hypothetical protein
MKQLSGDTNPGTRSKPFRIAGIDEQHAPHGASGRLHKAALHSCKFQPCGERRIG